MPRSSNRNIIEQSFTVPALANVEQTMADAFSADERGDAAAAADSDLAHAAEMVQGIDAVHHRRYLSTRSAVAGPGVTIGERLLAYERDEDFLRYRQLVRSSGWSRPLFAASYHV
ncbi:hypothetical protein CF326_g5623 [Tilletia indica]|nr:hypothetical protein CF326_g5623 [Tilletia indica]